MLLWKWNSGSLLVRKRMRALKAAVTQPEWKVLGIHRDKRSQMQAQCFRIYQRSTHDRHSGGESCVGLWSCLKSGVERATHPGGFRGTGGQWGWRNLGTCMEKDEGWRWCSRRVQGKTLLESWSKAQRYPRMCTEHARTMLFKSEQRSSPRNRGHSSQSFAFWSGLGKSQPLRWWLRWAKRLRGSVWLRLKKKKGDVNKNGSYCFACIALALSPKQPALSM